MLFARLSSPVTVLAMFLPFLSGQCPSSHSWDPILRQSCCFVHEARQSLMRYILYHHLGEAAVKYGNTEFRRLKQPSRCATGVVRAQQRRRKPLEIMKKLFFGLQRLPTSRGLIRRNPVGRRRSTSGLQPTGPFPTHARVPSEMYCNSYFLWI